MCYVGIFILGSNLDLRPLEEESYIVKATMYTTSRSQTDNTPLVTASGFKLNYRNPKQHRIIAVSRDLLGTLKFGTKVRLENAGIYDGEYIVHDVMNKRFKNRIDILINPKDKATTIDSVRLVILK